VPPASAWPASAPLSMSFESTSGKPRLAASIAADVWSGPPRPGAGPQEQAHDFALTAPCGHVKNRSPEAACSRLRLTRAARESPRRDRRPRPGKAVSPADRSFGSIPLPANGAPHPCRHPAAAGRQRRANHRAVKRYAGGGGRAGFRRILPVRCSRDCAALGGPAPLILDVDARPAASSRLTMSPSPAAATISGVLPVNPSVHQRAALRGWPPLHWRHHEWQDAGQITHRVG
jgi:hypothetical protein